MQEKLQNADDFDLVGDMHETSHCTPLHLQSDAETPGEPVEALRPRTSEYHLDTPHILRYN